MDSEMQQVQQATQVDHQAEQGTELVNQQVNITYETLFDILRVEKGRDDIQQLSATFFQDVVIYLQQKREVLTKKEHESGIDNFDEVKKLRIQYENVQRLIKEIYQRREKKILMVALNSSRTKRSIVNDEFFLEEEKMFFERLKFVLDENRKNNITMLLQGKIPGAIVPSRPAEHFRKEKEEVQEASQQAIPTTQVTQATAQIPTQDGSLQIRFLKDVDQFIGPELETYGPFAPNATALIPEKIADILIVDGKAEKV